MLVASVSSQVVGVVDVALNVVCKIVVEVVLTKVLVDVAGCS